MSWSICPECKSRHMEGTELCGSCYEKAQANPLPFVPECPNCESDDLIVVYQASVTQRVERWRRDDADTVVAEMYDTAEIDFDSELAEAHVECRDCGHEYPAVDGDTDRFRLVEAVPA